MAAHEKKKKKSSDDDDADQDEGWYVAAFGGKMSDEYKAYMATEWGFEKRGDVPLFEKLCLEGQQAGLSWATILAKRANYRRAFHGFDIERCAAMTEADVDALVASTDAGVIRHRGKLASIPHNARKVLELTREAQAENATSAAPEHGHFDAFLWSFVGGAPRLNALASFSAMPCQTDESRAMAAALKKRGFKFVGPTTCYAFMQSCGLVVDHLRDTPEWRAARDRIHARHGGTTSEGAAEEGKKTKAETPAEEEELPPRRAPSKKKRARK